MIGSRPADPAHERIADVVRALLKLVHNEGVPCLEFIDMKVVLDDGVAPQRGCFGTGAAHGPDRAVRAAEAALRDLRRHVSHAPAGREVPVTSDPPPARIETRP